MGSAAWEEDGDEIRAVCVKDLTVITAEWEKGSSQETRPTTVKVEETARRTVETCKRSGGPVQCSSVKGEAHHP